MKNKLTPLIEENGIWYKREDKAYDFGLELPSGAKMRQFISMAANHPKGTPMIVGCSAFSAMQIYVAAAAQMCDTKAIVYVPDRKTKSDATKWAEEHGAEVNFIRPGYPSMYKQSARLRADKEGGCIKWDTSLAIQDTIEQVVLPDEIRRIVVPTGSGLTAAGVIIGLHKAKHKASVRIVAVSNMCTYKSIEENVEKYGGKNNSIPYEIITLDMKYEKPIHQASIPDGTPLDPYYAGKVVHFLEKGDCFWIPGRRAI